MLKNILPEKWVISIPLAVLGYLASLYIANFALSYKDLLANMPGAFYIYFFSIGGIALVLQTLENKFVWSKFVKLKSTLDVWGLSFGLCVGLIIVY